MVSIGGMSTEFKARTVMKGKNKFPQVQPRREWIKSYQGIRAAKEHRTKMFMSLED